MVALTQAAQSEDYPADIVLVVSNRPEAAGLAKAKSLGISATAIDHKAFASRQLFEVKLHAALLAAHVQLVCCAGFMRVLTPWFVSRWEGRLLNIHPSLLPKYKGLNTHSRALKAGDKQHGCTVHYVTAELDDGEIILQDTITIESGDTAESLAAKLLPREQTLYVKALKQVATRIIPV